MSKRNQAEIREASVEMAGLLSKLNFEFEWDDVRSKFSITNSWERRGSLFYVAQSTSGKSVIVKQPGERRSHVSGFQLRGAMADVARIVDQASIANLGMPPPLAWTEHPTTLVMPYIEGDDLTSVLRDPDHAFWNDRGGTLGAWCEVVGAAVGAFHRFAPVAPVAYRDSVTDAHETLANLALSKALLNALIPPTTESLHARSLVDPAPSNFRRGFDGTIWMLDPPTTTRYEFVHRDAARFFSTVHRTVENKVSNKRREMTPDDRLELVKNAFLAGYARTNSQLDDDRNRRLIEAFESRIALGIARRINLRDPRRALRMGLIGLNKRRAVLRGSSTIG